MKNIVLCLFISISIDLIACNNDKNEINENISNSEKSKLKELEINNKYKIEPNDLRLNLLREYTKKHYGEACIYLNNPQIIVIHSTETENLEIVVNIFKNDLLIGREDIEFGGEVNVGTHFIIDTNGEIYSNTPLDYIARHTIGFNYTAISVENIGFADNLTEEQFNSNIKLIKYLKNKYNSIKYIIGHYEYNNNSLPHFNLYKELDSLTFYFSRNLDFYQYYRSKSTYLDRYYFTRNQNDLRICTDSSHIDKDPLYSTGYDFKVAKIITNELLKIYLTNRLQELERIVQRKADNGQVVETILRWTGSKRALVELIYALEANGDFNKGTATLKEIAGYFENVFSIDIGDLYHSYLEMRSRKINRTRYLETLQKSLLRRMDENDT